MTSEADVTKRNDVRFSPALRRQQRMRSPLSHSLEKKFSQKLLQWQFHVTLSVDIF